MGLATRRTIAAVAALMLTLGLPLAAPAAAGEPGLEHLGSDQLSPRLEEHRFATPALVGETRVRVLLPAGYDPDGDVAYPVLYLLHGGGGSEVDWTEQGDAEALTEAYEMIVVMPDGGGYGNYVDWWNHGAGGPPRWETYHIGQLIPWVDEHYRTTGDRDGRAIAGLSMGGGGTMHYAARHPDLFTAAAAFSGAVDTNTLPVQALVQTSGFEDGHPPGSVVGLRATDEVRWRGHNPWDLASNLQGLFLQLDTGNGLPGGPGGDTGDPVEAACYEMMTNLHERLAGLGYPHIWNAYGAGGHTWFYWQRDLSELLPRLEERFADPAPAPTPFRYRSIETNYSVWGWDVEIGRPALEFSELLDAGPEGFQLEGSGSAEVVTASYFRPGETLEVTVQDADGERRSEVQADDQGRVAVAVSLGPGNPEQQLSPAGTVWALTTGAPPGTWPSVTATVSLAPARVGSGAPADPTPVPPAHTRAEALPSSEARLPATGEPVSIALAAFALLGALLVRRAAGG